MSRKGSEDGQQHHNTVLLFPLPKKSTSWLAGVNYKVENSDLLFQICVFKPVKEVTCYEVWAQAKFSSRCKKKKKKKAARFPDGPGAPLTSEKDLRKGSSGGRKGHGLSVPFNILTTCVLSSLCLWPCVCPCGCLCAGLWLIDRQITTEEGEQRAKEMSVLFIETSAKTGYNVKQVESVCACAVP